MNMNAWRYQPTASTAKLAVEGLVVVVVVVEPNDLTGQPSIKHIVRCHGLQNVREI